MTVKDIDRGYKALFKRLAAENRGHVVDVGVFGADGSGVYEDGNVTVADVAGWMEFGTGDGRVPERSFIRTYVDDNRSEIEGWIREAAKRVVEGKLASFDHGLEMIGLRIETGIKALIRSGIDPPLADSTVARKGSTLPLVDTGQLISSITHEVKTLAEGV